MDRLEIISKINVLNNQIAKLKKDNAELERRKKQYEDINVKVCAALYKLMSAGQYVGSAATGLMHNYTSQEALQKVSRLRIKNDEINSNIGKINNSVLEQLNIKLSLLNSRISQNNSQITEKSRELKKLSGELYRN